MRRRAHLKVEETPVDFVKLEDGALAEMIEDPDDPNQTIFVKHSNGSGELVGSVSDRGRTLVPLRRRDGILAQVRLARGASHLRSGEVLPGVDYCERIAELIQTCSGLPTEMCSLIAAFVLCTWFADRLPVAPYLLVVGPPLSGKTSLLRLLQLLCYRSLLTVHITIAGLLEAYSRFRPTLLVDDFENTAASENRALRKFFRSGTNPDLYWVHGNRSASCFGPKVIACSKAPDDDTLRSRCICVSLVPLDGPLLSPDNPTTVGYCDSLVRSLVDFRLRNYERLRVEQVGPGSFLQPRQQSLFRCVAAPLALDSDRIPLQQLERRLLQAFAIVHDESLPHLDPVQEAIIVQLLKLLKSDAEWALIGQLTEQVNAHLRAAGERRHLDARKVGAELACFGLKRKRTALGYRLSFDQPTRLRINRIACEYAVIGNSAIARDSAVNCLASLAEEQPREVTEMESASQELREALANGESVPL